MTFTGLRKNEPGLLLLAHGDGGILTHELIKGVFQKYLTAPELLALTDAALLPGAGTIALTTDSFVVNPLFFPGGDIGKLAVAGTVNDLAVSGSKPKYLTAGFILEEGLDLALLERAVASMAATAESCGISLVAGDTKVVERGKGDGIYINTTGIGFKDENASLGYERIEPGDKILLNGGIGEHGVAVLAERAGFTFDQTILSDCAPLNTLITPLLETFGPAVKFMRDPTRGGLATTAKEIALASGRDLWLEETAIPVRAEVRGATEFLGLDPLYLANEGKCILITAASMADEIVVSSAVFRQGKGAP
ncbi:AIR synthase related protein, C-terminal domain [Acididesulfobacillus acetoxydans]|uniref:AIR synthase related protein, C-terminal domain n=1 Tax=Acididesulfobacillus acetoxydans TaxID=1561005 RepID=A0A8S0XAN9_9FIRM|nr:AIR synthase related protein, C-terminal domain [Acididesulfobacillus acetoxydans]CEJ09554.1 Hydrogenase expression/formation protein HupE [Acididesulfobacillus acetoxydans]